MRKTKPMPMMDPNKLTRLGLWDTPWLNGKAPEPKYRNR